MIEPRTDRKKGDKAWIGVDIGGTKTAVVLSSRPPVMLARIEFPTLPEQGPERAIAMIKRSIYQLVEMSKVDQGTLQSIGVSCGGPLNEGAGMILAPPNLSTWIDVPITSILQDEFDLHCRIENDANAGAVAEYQFGAGQGARHMVFLTMGTGLGAGVIANGTLLSGASGQAGEIGHVRLTPSGPLGYNKEGSVEGWASGAGMAQMAVQEVARAIRLGEATLLAEKFHQDGILNAKDVADAFQQGDGLAERIIESTGCRLGEGLAILVDLFNPEKIVVGGLAIRLGMSLLGPAHRVMLREALPASAKICQIVPAELGEAIGDVAAICVAMGLSRHSSEVLRV